MSYQDLKVRDAGRILAMAIGLAVIIAVCLCFPAQARPILNALPIGRGNDRFLLILAGLGIVSVVCFVMTGRYMLTSPEQDAAFMQRAVKRGRKMPERFDPTLLDSHDPNYAVPTYIYLLHKIQAR